jgi:hypothetical protein
MMMYVIKSYKISTNWYVFTQWIWPLVHQAHVHPLVVWPMDREKFPIPNSAEKCHVQIGYAGKNDD